MIVAAVLLVVFSAVASTDSLYFHTYKYRLHTRPSSRREHFYHTANICLFVPQVILMFCVRPSGLWLAAAAALSAATFGVEMLDVLCERDSRRDLGGLIPAEYAMHFLMSTLRAGFVFSFFAGFQLADFAAPAQLAPVAPWCAAVGWTMAVPGFLVAALHLWMCRPLPRPSPAANPSTVVEA
jgi:hypothetical protein